MQNFASLQDGINAQGGRLNLVGQKLLVWLKKIPLSRWQQIAVALLIIWLAHSLAVLFWMLAAAPAIPQAQVAENAILRDSAVIAPRSVDIAALRQLDMFGVSTVDTTEAVKKPEPTQGPQIEDQAVDTKLKLVLQGVISSSEIKDSRAIIAQGKAQEIYSAGDEIAKLKNVKVAKVLDLRVILDNKGRYESLWLYSDDPNAPKAKRVAVSTPSRSWDEGDAEPAKPEYDSPRSDVRDRALQRNGRKEDSDDDDSLEAAGKRLADVVAINIHRVKGKVKGYRLRPGRDASAFAALGLEAGDIVTAVNGEMLDNPSKIMEIYRSIGKATSANLEIERDGSPMNIDIQLD